MHFGKSRKAKKERLMSSSDPSPLHLPSLSIERFRGINSLWLPKLGQATLLTGKNGVGKTTVLEAARIWAARGTMESIGDLLLDREEIISENNGKTDQNDCSYIKTLFWGRNPKKSDTIKIGPIGSDNSELLQLTYVDSYSKSNLTDRLKVRKDVQIFPGMHHIELSRKIGKHEQFMVWTTGSLENAPIDLGFRAFLEDVQFIWLDAGLSGTRTIVGFWTKFALTPTENRAVNALNFVTAEKIERIAVVGEGNVQKMIVKMEHSDNPVPLRSLGDGATRMLVVASAISCSRDGFLFLDEAEIGIHYSAQAKFWKMVLQAAYTNNVQVIATTHSFDSVRGFAEAVVENNAVDGVLVRLEEHDGVLKAITFDESELEVVARRKIEVR